MKIKVPSEIKQNPVTLLRRLGYAPARQRTNSQLNFTRRLGTGFYPRFHIYLSSDQKSLNLHLDQKRPSYHGQKAHSGEYDSELIQQESARINQLLKIT